MDEKSLQLKVVIADRTYRMKVAADEESNVRKAARLLNTKVRELQGAYRSTDKQDFLAMAALLLLVDVLNKEEQVQKEGLQINQNLQELDVLLTAFLDK